MLGIALGADSLEKKKGLENLSQAFVFLGRGGWI
jgi:hypothetical protein